MQSATVPQPALPSVLVVDDSAVARAVIGRAIEGGRRFSVAGSVADAGAAFDFLKHTPVDAIVLDLEMPGVDGLTALPNLIAASAGAPVLVVSSACDEGAVSTIRALALGAADTLVKPGVGNFAGRFGQVLEERLARLVQDVGQQPFAPTPVGVVRSDFDLIAIGASTGGIHALSVIVGALHREVDQPIVITQHLPESFMPYFATQVALVAKRPCTVATESARLERGRILVAPGDAHVRLVKTSDGAAIRLSREPAPSGCRPSVDPMLESAADVFGARALAIVLSGMGRDGAIGAQKVTAAGGSVVVQDKESSVVWGMPGAIASAGYADAILPPDAIGRLVASREAAMLSPQRTEPPPTRAMTAIAGLFSQRTGQSLSAGRSWRIDSALQPLLRARDIADLDTLATALTQDGGDRLASAVIDALLNQETSFYRDAGVIELAADVLAARREADPLRRPRVWSAGCSAGQEPYSLAMLSAERSAAPGDRPDIVASDVSEAAIARARGGRYSQFEIQRGLPIRRMLAWFDQDGDEYVAKPELVRLVSFRRHNLVADPPPYGQFDLILCRNVLLYFPPAIRTAVFERLATALRPGGSLILGAGETTIGQTDRFVPSQRFRGCYDLANASRAN